MIAAVATRLGSGHYDDNMEVVTKTTRSRSNVVTFAVDERTNCVQVDVYIIPRLFDMDPTLQKEDLFYQPRDIRYFRYEKELEDKYTRVYYNRKKKTNNGPCYEEQQQDDDEEEEQDDELSSIMRRRFLRQNIKRCKSGSSSSKASRRQQRILAAATLLM